MSKMYKYTGILPARRINIHHNSVILVSLSPRGSPAADTRVLRGLHMCLTVSRLCHILLPKPLSGYAKEPFPHCETGFPALPERLFGCIGRAFLQDERAFPVALESRECGEKGEKWGCGRCMTGVRKAFRGISVFCFTIYGCQNFLLRKCMNMQNAVTVLKKRKACAAPSLSFFCLTLGLRACAPSGAGTRTAHRKW